MTTAPELASTYLNLCAVYSDLAQHSESVDKALKSVMLIRNHIQRVKSENYKGNDLADVIKKDESDKTLNFLHKPRTRVPSDVNLITADLCGDDDLEGELVKCEMSNFHSNTSVYANEEEI